VRTATQVRRRRGILVDGRGATIQATLTEPNAFTITDGWDQVSSSRRQRESAAPLQVDVGRNRDFAPLNPVRDVYSWYVTGDDSPAATRDPT